jgi:hypothetical protein
MRKLLGGLVGLLGGAFLVRLFRPLMEDIRFLEQRKKPRGERGRRFLDRMGAGQSYLRPGSFALRGRDLRSEDLADAFLVDADLSDTDLRGVDLAGANLENAILANADLRGADLSRADLTNTRLLGARYDAATRWPEGFDPARSGAVREE